MRSKKTTEGAAKTVPSPIRVANPRQQAIFEEIKSGRLVWNGKVWQIHLERIAEQFGE
jgi:hypothetical protein